MLRQIKPAVERGDERCRLPGKQREGIVVEMEVQQVEIVGAAPNALEHGHVQRIWIEYRAIEPQGSRPARFQFGGGLRVAAREQDDVVFQSDQRLRQPRTDAPISGS